MNGVVGGEADVSFIFTSDTSKYSSLALSPKYLCCTVTVTSFSLAVWVQKKKKRKTLEYIMTEMEAFL